jgi:hypothetical protein
MSKDTGLIQLAGLQALATLNDVISELSTTIVVLKDERDEYRRKWLEATKCESIDEELVIKQITSNN